MSLRGAVGAALLALCCAAVAPGGQAQTLTLTLPEARVAARGALLTGNGVAARVLARGLVAADPGDFAALALLSAAETMAGDAAAGAVAGRRAFGAADTAAERYEAAALTAAGFARDGRMTLAQYWFRRAGHAAPDPVTRAAAVAAFRLVEARAPLSVRVRLSVAPSSNVNNGSTADTVEIFGLPFVLSPAARAIAGGAATASVALRYRVAQGARSQTHLTATALWREVWLSEAVVGVRPGDFGYASGEVGVEHRRAVGSQGHVLRLGAAVGTSRYGGAKLADTLRAEVGIEAPLGPTLAGGVTLGGEKQWRFDAAARESETIRLSGTLMQTLAAGGRLRLDLGLRNTWSQAADTRHGAASVRVGWEPGAAVMGMRFGFGLAAEGRDYGASALAPGGRRDLRLDAEMSVTFEAVGYMGFSPALDLRASRALSTVPLYDGVDLGVTLGVVSTF